MATPIQTVLEQIAKRVAPNEDERAKMSQLAERLKGQVQNILDRAGFGGKVSIQGSYARDTWLSGEADLDIFASFPPSMDRRGRARGGRPTNQKGKENKSVDRCWHHTHSEIHIVHVT